MKKFMSIIASVLITTLTLAQAPEKMSYQAVVRDASNALVSNASVGMQISILQGSAIGSAVYVETQTPTSNANGLVTIEIGGGTAVSGDFTTIDWANGPYFVKTETDPAGGMNYTISGTSQLLSVPYALHAKTAENVVGGSASAPQFITPINIFQENSGTAAIGDTRTVNLNQVLGQTVNAVILQVRAYTSFSNTQAKRAQINAICGTETYLLVDKQFSLTGSSQGSSSTATNDMHQVMLPNNNGSITFEITSWNNLNVSVDIIGYY